MATPLAEGRFHLMNINMRVTILETGRPPGPLAQTWPGYPDMFESLLTRAADGLSFENAPVVDGAPLPDPAAAEAILITGSPAGVYDPEPWMEPLRGYVQAAAAQKKPMIGVCFGHQIIADALGGEVRKSEKGWGVGRHEYEIVERRPWMVDAGEAFALTVSHQDQVITPPSGATTLARCAHTDHAMLVYQDAPIMSVQGHPEFSDSYAIALYNARRSNGLGDELADTAIESLAAPEDNALFAEWMVKFLRTVR